eukprot:96146_1
MSKIAALQARLGGGAMIMGGMPPGGVNPRMKRRKKARRNSLDNSALLNRATVNRGNRKAKKVALDFDELDDGKEDDGAFNQSLAGDINTKKTKPISQTPEPPSSTQKPTKKK